MAECLFAQPAECLAEFFDADAETDDSECEDDGRDAEGTSRQVGKESEMSLEAMFEEEWLHMEQIDSERAWCQEEDDFPCPIAVRECRASH